MSSGAAVFNSRYSRAVLSKSDWEDHREFIQKHYIENDKTLEDLKVLLKDNLGVEVTKHQLEYRCRRWKFRKNYSQAYPRQSQNQSVLKFPPVEAKKGRMKQKASCEPQPGPTRQKVRMPQDDGASGPNFATHGFCQFSSSPPASNDNGLSSYAALQGYDDRPSGALKQDEIYSSTQGNSYNPLLSVRGQNELLDTRRAPRHELDEYKSTGLHDSQLLFNSSTEYNPSQYVGHSTSPLDQSFETSMESLHLRDRKNDTLQRQYAQEYPSLNTANFRNDLTPYLDTGYNTWPLSAPPFPYCESMNINWDADRSTTEMLADQQLDPNVCAAPLSHQQQNNFESTFPTNTHYMDSGNTPRRSVFRYSDTMTREWNN
ncbi:hypothetical protein AOL_s00083g131 [Orbilia oligospora ATCC 24927]|uniref:Clr5 domain-containing protein n=1 Tax=Arthrobotrys oligospora (strain ATCC 24927 / CBS 115.81 / DSM 1491) TaxID=756982 RepID=G1XGK0_ARTOA|nr:hypothetical protein AOL_s00083g131 [Orbilia oligospora ATCC 24927]EGX47623.1 hypothetical protein AOL_s00083g131 [Orbilia oligospora ATCC 24927]